MAILVRPGLLPHPAADARPACVAASPVASLSEVIARGGDEHAEDRSRLTTLYAEHGTRIHRFLRDLLGDASLAADATQETFVRAYRKLGEISASARVAPWLFGIARNVSLEMRRARLRASRHVVLDETADGVALGSPESEYLDREAVRVIAEALARLPEERRAMLLLRLDHGLSYEDIAVTMSCSLAKVKVEIFRAREVLRAVMTEYDAPRETRRGVR